MTSHHRPVATLATVAAVAGVSRQTVSNALNNPELLRPDTLARVRQQTLAVSGGARSFVRPEDVAALAALVQGGRHVVIDAGHEVHVHLARSRHRGHGGADRGRAVPARHPRHPHRQHRRPLVPRA